MERCFIATEESEYFKDITKYLKLANKQKEVINLFFNEKGIESNFYKVSGSGLVNIPFEKSNKNNIRLSIDPTENDLINFGNILCKSDNHKLRTFRKGSNISKEFSQKCIDEQVVINLFCPRVNDYFSSLRNGLYGCRYQSFMYNDGLYIKVESEYLNQDDIPNGFIEIKLSEYYCIKEKIGI